MITGKTYIFFSLLAFLCGPAFPQPLLTDSVLKKNIVLNEIVPGLYQLCFGYDAVTAVVTSEGVVMVDAGISHTITRLMAERLSEKLPSAHTAYLILTHGHADHTGGCCVYRDAVIVSAAAAVGEIEKSRQDTSKAKARLSAIAGEYEAACGAQATDSEDAELALTQYARYYLAAKDISAHPCDVLPSLLILDSLSLSCGGITFRIFYFGKAHSESDLLIYIPELRLMFTGDLMSHYGMPSFEEKAGDVGSAHLRLAARIEALIPVTDMVIGGHGKVFTAEALKVFVNNVRNQN